MRPSPSTPLGWLRLQLSARRSRAGRERGASTSEWVLVAAILLVVAAVLAVVIYNLVVEPAPPVEPPRPPGGL
ncbi:MAG TPA: hypothetical protein VJ644_02355 [Jiangellaceae bacterium]|nr:hypothetical protein [Jiangellaceae bacterium]